ncbi:hypothetical protein BaRGS_00014403 [Batillaria attramentaria]|uniref:BTB domain-containing protein n=1 Tax=Batillaria attramentaria TaxID=370345 RepID=A0ABD0L4C9_9CAEN
MQSFSGFAAVPVTSPAFGAAPAATLSAGARLLLGQQRLQPAFSDCKEDDTAKEDQTDKEQADETASQPPTTPEEVHVAPFSVADELSDVVLEVEGEELHVNRAVLAHYSPVFSRMFFGDFKEKDQTKVTLPDKSYVHFTTFLQVMYPQTPGAEELISDENLVQILELAEEYHVDHVKARCQDYIGSQLSEHYYKNSTCAIQSPFPAISSLELVSRMMLYIWMCDQYGLPKHRARLLSIFIKHAVNLDSLQNSPYYESLPLSSKVNLLETLCRKLQAATSTPSRKK